MTTDPAPTVTHFPILIFSITVACSHEGAVADTYVAR